jgi:hypothetical protein
MRGRPGRKRLKGAGNTRVTRMQIADRDHGSIANKIADEGDPARAAIQEFVRTNGGAQR